MVLCAGFGTRLRPLTDERPKPLVPLGDRTLLEHVLDHLEQFGFASALVNAHHLSDVFLALTDGWSRIPKVVVEAEILGTAGGVRGARSEFAPGAVLVTNGDVLAPFEPRRLLARVDARGLCLAVAPRAAGSGSIGVGEGGRVVRLRGERFGAELAGGDYVGTMALGAGVLEGLPEAGCLIGDVALPLLRRGAPVVTDPISGAWSAPGDGIAEYLNENLAWLEQRRLPAGESFVAPRVQVSDAVALRSCVLGEGANVAGSGPFERVVVWPGARAVAPLADAVVLGSGRVVPRPTG